MKKVYLALGSNIGSREDFLKRSVAMLNETCGPVLSSSAVYTTDPVGFNSEVKFLNMVIMLETEMEASEMLHNIMLIEAELGRERIRKGYSSRTIDIDILFYGDEVIAEESLKVPHPRLHERKFVLVPLNEIAPDLVHPVFKKKIELLLASCHDRSEVKLSNG